MPIRMKANSSAPKDHQAAEARNVKTLASSGDESEQDGRHQEAAERYPLCEYMLCRQPVRGSPRHRDVGHASDDAGHATESRQPPGRSRVVRDERQQRDEECGQAKSGGCEPKHEERRTSEVRLSVASDGSPELTESVLREGVADGAAIEPRAARVEQHARAGAHDEPEDRGADQLPDREAVHRCPLKSSGRATLSRHIPRR